MFCPKCGNELEENARFCGKCGAPVKLRKVAICPGCGNELKKGARFCTRCGTQVESVRLTAPEKQVRETVVRQGTENGNTVIQFELKNVYIEKAVGISGVLPAVYTAILLIYWLIRGIIRMLFGGYTLLYSYSFFPRLVRGISSVTVFVSVIILIASLCIVGLLAYLYFDHRAIPNRMLISSMANAAILMLAAIVYMKTRFGFIVGIIIMLPLTYLGLCIANVIFIRKEGLSGEIDFRIFDDMKFQLAKAEEAPDPSKYTDPNIVEYEKTEEIEELDSYFDGTGLQLLGHVLVLLLITSLTCGIMAPWGLKRIFKWKNDHIVIEGKRLNFNGTAMGVFGKWLKNYVLTAITCGIYSFFAYVDLKKWEVRHTTYLGEENQSESDYIDSYFDGNSFENMGYQILMFVGSLLTCSLLFPYLYAIYYKWHAKHTVIHGNRLFYDGQIGKLYLDFIIIILLSLITCGLYLPWGITRLNRYFYKHTHIDATYRGPEVIVRNVNSQVY